MDFEITIDGRKAGVTKGETILQVTNRIGIEIPVFCWHPKIDPVGACRMCLVEVEKMPKLVVACATPAAPNMVVRTQTARVQKARKGVIEFLLIDHPLDCPTCDKGGECLLQDNVYHYGLDRSRFTETKHRFERDPEFFLDDVHIGPQIIRNMNRCIRCYRCTRFTQEVAGEGDLGIFNRGWKTEIDTLPDREIGNLYSGNTVEICPVGALTSENFRYSARPWLSYRIPSVCNLCPDGCNLTLWSDQRKLFRATSRRNDAVDEGWICDRGRYAYAYRQSKARITTPRKRDGDAWSEIAWPEAIDEAAQALKGVLDRHGAGAVGGMISPLAANESIYLFQRFFRSVLSSNSVDWRADRKLLASPERRRRNRAFPRLTRPIAKLEQTELIIACGCDLENERPITALRILKARRKQGAKLILLNNRPTRLRRKADSELFYKPGSEQPLWSALLKLIAEQKDAAKQAPALAKALGSVNVEKLALQVGLTVEKLKELATMIGEASSCVVYLGRDIRQAPNQGAIVDLALAAGALLGLDGGDKGAIELSPEHANALGATLMGGEPEVLPGGVDAHDANCAARLAELWGAPLPAAGGYDAVEMLEAAHNDRLKALVLLDVNPLMTYPDTAWVEAALAKLDCIVALGQFDFGRPGFAHLFLPTATPHEESGTFISGEGRLQYFEAAAKPTGGALPARSVLSQLAQALGANWDYPSAQAVYREMSLAMPALTDSSHAALRDTEGKLLTPNVHQQDSGALFDSAAEALKAEQVELPGTDAQAGYLLVTGNMGHHFGELTAYSEPITNFAAVPYALLHPLDAAELEVEQGSWIKLSSARGDIELTARLSPLVASGMVLVPLHYPEANPHRLCDRSKPWDRVKVTRIEGREKKEKAPSVAVAEVGAWTP